MLTAGVNLLSHDSSEQSNADLVLKKHFLLSMLQTLVLLDIFGATMILFYYYY